MPDHLTSNQENGLPTSNGLTARIRRYLPYLGLYTRDIQDLIEETDRQRAEIAELRGALEALYDEQNGPPLFSRERQWKVAMERAKVALTRSHAEPGKAP